MKGIITLFLTISISMSGFAASALDVRETFKAMLRNKEFRFANCLENPTAAAKLAVCLPYDSPEERAIKIGKMAIEYKKAGLIMKCLASPAIADLVCKSEGRSTLEMVNRLKEVFREMMDQGFSNTFGNLKAAAEILD